MIKIIMYTYSVYIFQPGTHGRLDEFIPFRTFYTSTFDVTTWVGDYFDKKQCDMVFALWWNETKLGMNIID